MVMRTQDQQVRPVRDPPPARLFDVLPGDDPGALIDRVAAGFEVRGDTPAVPL
jgi:hypothetical protein